MATLLLIDLQEDFFGPTRIAPNPFIDNLPRLLRHLTTRRRPIVWIDSEYAPDKDTSKNHGSGDTCQNEFERYLAGTHSSGRFCVANTAGIQIHKDLQPLLHPHHTRITKTYYSAFTKTALHEILQQAGTKHTFLAGVTTNTCVAATAVDARKLGYQVTIVEDCAKAATQQLHDRAIHRLTGSPYSVSLCTSNDVSSHLDDEKQLPVLYWVNGSIPSWRVMIALAWKEVPYISKRLRVMTDPKETRSPEFALINPRCKTPTFIDSDGTTVIESMAILQYLERFYTGPPENGTLSKSKWMQQMVGFHESENLHRAYEPIELLYDVDHEKHCESILQAYRDVFEELEHWERHLTNDGLLTAQGAFRLADVAFYPILAYMVHRGLNLAPKYPALRDYYERCAMLQAALEARPDHWEKPGKSLFLKCENLLKEREIPGV